MADGQPAYVTAASTTDTQDGWRDRRRDGGVVMSVPSGEVVTAGLSMPHSPVVEGDRLWIASSGAGELGVVDAGGAFEPVAQLPGLTRGLALHGHFAVVGASKPRRGESLAGLPLEDRMPASGGGSRCGVFVVDLDTGRLEHSILFDGGPPEVQDVAVLRDCRSPDAVEFNGDLVQEWVTVPTDLATVQENQRKGGAST
jgi:uncharacterized protein (TIGR03032 family)